MRDQNEILPPTDNINNILRDLEGRAINQRQAILRVVDLAVGYGQLEESQIAEDPEFVKKFAMSLLKEAQGMSKKLK